MARTTTSLTNTQVDKAKAKDKEYNLADGKGLMLRVKPNGSKLWLFNYMRPYTKKRANISFGVYPDVTLLKAREKGVEARALLAQNIDPKADRDSKEKKLETENNNTFEHVSFLHFEIKKKTITPDYAEDIWRSFELHLFPKIGKVPIRLLDAPFVINALKPISKKSLETVKRLCQRMNEVMVYALNTGMISQNPLAGIKKAFETPAHKHMPTITPAELPELMKALSKASIRITTRYLIEWQLHTMTRPTEAAGARWDEIDIQNGLWVIPAERMKKRKAHTVPLTEQALSLLEAIKPHCGNSEFVFAGERSFTKPVNSSTANMALKRMGYHGKLVAHGLRSLASTTLNEQGFDSDIIEACLAHADKNKVRAAYNRADYIERRKKVMNWWSDHIEKAATGNLSLATSKKGLSVVSS
jgi:integrase